tara:strand:+ start:494 stop:679 length:186 start_codon:yes stop_codon:yes gene_type:complete
MNPYNLIALTPIAIGGVIGAKKANNKILGAVVGAGLAFAGTAILMYVIVDHTKKIRQKRKS